MSAVSLSSFVLLNIISLYIVLSLVGCGPTYAKGRLSVAGATVAHIHARGKGYGSGQTDKLYKQFKKMGIDSVQLNTFVYQPNISTIKMSYNDPTLTPIDLKKEIRLAHKHGLNVMLKPHVWLGGYPNKQWRNEITYKKQKDVDKWFAEYWRFLKGQALAAKQTKVAYFVIGTELVGMSKFTSHWQGLVKKIRQLGYQGKLSYACEAWNAKNIKFWSDLDFIGLDFYYGVKKDDANNLDKLENIIAEKLTYHRKLAQALNKPIILTELGFPSHEMAWHKPYSWPSHEVRANDEKQVKAYLAFRRAVRRVGSPFGIFFWKYVTTLNSYERGQHNKGFILQQKPAENEIKKIIFEAKSLR